jgi:hypothetical protein
MDVSEGECWGNWEESEKGRGVRHEDHVWYHVPQRGTCTDNVVCCGRGWHGHRGHGHGTPHGSLTTRRQIGAWLQGCFPTSPSCFGAADSLHPCCGFDYHSITLLPRFYLPCFCAPPPFPPHHYPKKSPMGVLVQRWCWQHSLRGGAMRKKNTHTYVHNMPRQLKATSLS